MQSFKTETLLLCRQEKVTTKRPINGLKYIIYKICLSLCMDLTNRQLTNVSIVLEQNEATASKIRTLLSEPISPQQLGLILLFY